MFYERVVTATPDFFRKRNQYWRMIRTACSYKPEDILPSLWLEQQWGIKPIMQDGMISDEYHIVDEKKYLMFLLKFGE